MAAISKGNGAFGAGGAFARLLFSLFLVLATYNPSGRSYWHWLLADGATGPKLLVGLVLVAVYVALVVATWEVIGFTGTFLTATICLGGTLLLADLGLLDLTDDTTVALLLCLSVAVVIAVGLSFSFVFSRVTGILHTRGSIH
jgi:hypothetical protein